MFLWVVTVSLMVDLCPTASSLHGPTTPDCRSAGWMRRNAYTHIHTYGYMEGWGGARGLQPQRKQVDRHLLQHDTSTPTISCQGISFSLISLKHHLHAANTWTSSDQETTPFVFVYSVHFFLAVMANILLWGNLFGWCLSTHIMKLDCLFVFVMFCIVLFLSEKNPPKDPLHVVLRTFSRVSLKPNEILGMYYHTYSLYKNTW